MIRLFTMLALTLLAAGIATAALAVPAPLSEQELTDKSDLVALVRVLSVTCTTVTKDEQTGEDLPSYLAKLEVKEVKKGDVKPGESVLVTWRAAPKSIVGPWAVYYYPGEVVWTHLTKRSNGATYASTWLNAKRKPFDDPRVRRAMHLLCDKQVLVDVVKDVSPLMTGGFIYPFSEFATPKDQLAKRLGYQDDPGAAIKEAKSLLAAVGQSDMRPLDFMVRDLNHHKLFGQAIQAMLREAGIQSNLRTVVESVWFGDATAGNYDLAVGAIVSTLLDPSDYFNAWYRTDGPQNYSFWHNPAFDKLVDQIDVETDTGKRMALVRQAEDLMEEDPPLVPVAWENILDVWYNYVRGHNPKDNFGIYDVVRFDTVWLDKA